ncbi:MAG: redox-sensing transcriptional repressor Rex [bacterium]|nr:redox-sensing transcriptional repressor Rex [bacterium]
MCSEPTIKRLSVYHKYLKEVEASGQEFISCTKIAKNLHLLPIQVRKDLSITDIVGKPRVGYHIKDLRDSLDRFLSFGKGVKACLIGAGNLGYSLLRYKGFDEYGLDIKFVFDNNPDKIDTYIDGHQVLDIKNMAEHLSKTEIDVGVLTVPRVYAQTLANKLVECGVKALWNFAPIRLLIPQNVVVKHENIAGSFLVLASRIKQIR